MKLLLSRIEAIAMHEPNAAALISDQHSVSYAELQVGIESLQNELSQQGIKRLALIMPNSVEWVLTDLAAAAAGLTVVPVPSFFSDSQIQHLLDDAAIEHVVSLSAQPLHPMVASSGDRALLQGRLRLSKRLPQQQHAVVPDCAKVTYTSGSTGQPKGVCLAAETLESVVTSLADRLKNVDMQRHLCTLPFATLLENVTGIYLPLFRGHSLIVAEPSQLGLLSNSEFRVDAFAEAVQRHQASSVILLPQMLKSIVAYAEQHQHSFASLNLIAVGGGKTSAALIEQAHQLQLPVYEGYGLSECGSVVSINSPHEQRLGSVGKPLNRAEIHIAADGEILISGASMIGYIGQPKLSSADDQLLATGDLGYIDSKGFLHVTGRKKNCIVSSFGRNISPEWVESVAMAEPDILQVAVFGEAQPFLTAVVVASADISEQQLAATIGRCNRQLPDYARIRRWVRAVEPFSFTDGLLTANGKLQRDAIAARYHPLATAAGTLPQEAAA